MCLCDQLADNLAMPAMDAIKDADGEPCVLYRNFFEGMIMSHRIKKPPDGGFMSLRGGRLFFATKHSPF
jgi:hypothetical protein